MRVIKLGLYNVRAVLTVSESESPYEALYMNTA